MLESETFSDNPHSLPSDAVEEEADEEATEESDSVEEEDDHEDEPSSSGPAWSFD